MRQALLLLALIVLAAGPTRADDTLTLTFGDNVRRFTAAELLARPDASDIEVPDDVSYGRAMRYRAVPLLALIGEVPKDLDTLEASAADGFVSQIPRALVEKGANGGSTAWLAIDDAQQPWPPLPGKDASAGPFYIVWQHPARSGIGSEQWPYQTVAITGVESPAHRWPQMRVSDDLPANAPARHGQSVFTTQCMPCHRIKGAGVAELGPDLGQPMNPTQYMTEEGLRALIRNPKAVRTWPNQIMPGFDEKKLSAADLDAVIAYLAQMARQ